MSRQELINRVLNIMNDPKFAVTQETKNKRVIYIMPDLSILVEMNYMCYISVSPSEYASDHWVHSCSTKLGKAGIFYKSHITLFCFRNVYDSVRYYYVPKCIDSWIFGAMNYIFHTINNCRVSKLYVLEGDIVVLSGHWKIFVTKDTITIFDHLGTGWRYVQDFTRDFLISTNLYNCEVMNWSDAYNFESYHFCGEISGNSFDDLVRKIYHAYIDYVWPRNFVGFEDVCINVVGDDI